VIGSRSEGGVISETIVSDKIADLLQRNGAEAIVGFPENRLLNSAAALGMRPIITRTERVAVNIADGFARASNGERLLPCVMQYGPGAEAAYAAVAQAFGDRSPILLIPGEYDTADQSLLAGPSAAEAYRPITVWSATLNAPADGPGVFRRALAAVLGVRRGPVMVAVANDVLYTPAEGPPWEVGFPGRRRSQAAVEDVREVASILGAASAPVIVAGHGVLYAQATPGLVRLAEALGAPVATTLNGKSAFPEDHPLSLGAGARTRPVTVDHFYAGADVILGVGTSLSRSPYITPIPSSARLGQIVDDPRDFATGYDVDFGCLGDVKLVLGQLLAELGEGGAGGRADVRSQVEAVRHEFHQEWLPRLVSDASPLSPYRVVWELMHTVDRMRTVVTHDAGHPRDQMVPFYESLVPRGYLGWGKSTQLGTGLGLAMGARLARPDWLAVNVMGDAAFGMAGLDLETAVRCGIPIVTIVLNNGRMAGYTDYMPDAAARFAAHKLSGNYSAVAKALGCHAERVERAEELRGALERCIAAVNSGHAALLEVITHEELAMAAPALV
jgi:thiamine pyrophosphate-dependent acetolactate synthase large subunit-like protein